MLAYKLICRVAQAISLVCVTHVVTIAISGPAASTAGYSFVLLADSTGPLRQIHLPVISNTGVVAFTALLDDGSRGLFALHSGVLTQIGDSARFPEFNFPSISDNGTIVFCVREENSGAGTGIFAWRPNELLEVVNRADGPFTDLNTLPNVNNRDYVVFWGRLSTGDVIARKRIGSGTFEILNDGAVGPDQAPGLNDANTVAFVSGLPRGGNGIVTVGRNGFVERVTDRGPFALFSGAVSLNDSGEVAFHGTLDSGPSGVFVSTDSGVEPIALSGSLLDAPHRPMLNNRGEVVFMATANGIPGIFAGPDPVHDKVVALGDTIEGMRVDSVDFFRGLNDRGQIVFTITQQGIYKLYRADPRPKRR